MTGDEELARANECRMILDNKYVKQALTDIETALVEQIVQCPLEKRELQEQMVNILRAKRKFVEILQSHIASGKLVQFHVEQEQQKQSFVRSLFGR